MHGRVTELAGATHKRYNMALAVLLAKDMDAVVVDSEKVARQCIEYLKSHRVPAMVFYPLQSLRVSRHPSSPQQLSEATHKCTAFIRRNLRFELW